MLHSQPELLAFQSGQLEEPVRRGVGYRYCRLTPANPHKPFESRPPGSFWLSPFFRSASAVTCLQLPSLGGLDWCRQHRWFLHAVTSGALCLLHHPARNIRGNKMPTYPASSGCRPCPADVRSRPMSALSVQPALAYLTDAVATASHSRASICRHRNCSLQQTAETLDSRATVSLSPFAAAS